jgi:hypothetical protein
MQVPRNASPGTGTLWFRATGISSASFESSICQIPLSEIVVLPVAHREWEPQYLMRMTTVLKRKRVIMSDYSSEDL